MSNTSVIYKILHVPSGRYISGLGSTSMLLYNRNSLSSFYTTPKGKIWKNKESVISAFHTLFQNLSIKKELDQLKDFELIEAVLVEKNLDLKSIFSDILTDKKLDTFLNTLNK